METITDLLYLVPEIAVWTIAAIALVLPLATKNFLGNRVLVYLLLPTIAALGMFWQSEIYWYLLICIVAVIGVIIRSKWGILSTLSTAVVVLLFHVYAAPNKLNDCIMRKDYNQSSKILHVGSVSKNQLQMLDDHIYERYPDTITSYNKFIDGSIHLINSLLEDSSANSKKYLTLIMNDWNKILVLNEFPEEKEYNKFNNCICPYNLYLSKIKKRYVDFEGEEIAYLWKNSSYKGTLVKGKRVGNGLMVYPDSSTYEGDWNNDLRSGNGTYKSVEYSYVGFWDNDMPNGNGEKTWSNGGKYVGSFLDSMRSGEGTMLYADGSRYEGTWLNDQRSGQGNLKFKDGSTYDGSWLNDQFSGKGTFMSKSETYVGDWKEGKKHGRGIWKDNNGKSYTGGWYGDLYHGNGTYKSKTETYVGEWYSGKKQGQGKWQTVGGTSYSGGWYSNLFHGKGSYKTSSTSYSGEWSMGKKDGKGVMKYSSGAVYNGEFSDDFRSGNGVMKYKDGSVYRGGWSDDKREGKGQLVLSNGKTVTGQWSNDECPEPEENKNDGDFSWGKALFGIGAAAFMLLF